MLEFNLPDFIDESDEDIHERMLRVAPRNFDVSQGSLFYDVTKPTALEKARMIEFQLAAVVMMMFPQFAEGEHVDYHGWRDSITRRPPVRSRGWIKIKGNPGLRIPRGTIVSTDSTNEEGAIEFQTLETVTIDDNGSVTVGIESVLAGARANVPPESIVNIVSSGLNGVYSLINEESTSGGTEEESDDSLKERIVNRNRQQRSAGNVDDYIAWAKEVPGVGEVTVLPIWNGPQTVKVLITDSSGNLADGVLISQVQNHIDPSEGYGGGKAPIGAIVTVDTFTRKVIDISVKIYFASNYDQETVLQEMRRPISDYLAKLGRGETVIYAKIGALIIKTEGIHDYEYDSLLVNDAKSNITLEDDEKAILGEVMINE